MSHHLVRFQSVPSNACEVVEMPSQTSPAQACDTWKIAPAPVSRQDMTTMAPFQLPPSGISGLRTIHENFHSPLTLGSRNPSQHSSPAGILPTPAENRSKRKALMLERQRDRSRVKKPRVRSSNGGKSKSSIARGSVRVLPSPSIPAADKHFEMMANGLPSVQASVQSSFPATVPLLPGLQGFSVDQRAVKPSSGQRMESLLSRPDSQRYGIEGARSQSRLGQGSDKVQFEASRGVEGSRSDLERSSTSPIDLLRYLDPQVKHQAEIRTNIKLPGFNPCTLPSTSQEQATLHNFFENHRGLATEQYNGVVGQPRHSELAGERHQLTSGNGVGLENGNCTTFAGLLQRVSEFPRARAEKKMEVAVDHTGGASEKVENERVPEPIQEIHGTDSGGERAPKEDVEVGSDKDIVNNLGKDGNVELDHVEASLVTQKCSDGKLEDSDREIQGVDKEAQSGERPDGASDRNEDGLSLQVGQLPAGESGTTNVLSETPSTPPRLANCAENPLGTSSNPSLGEEEESIGAAAAPEGANSGAAPTAVGDGETGPRQNAEMRQHCENSSEDPSNGNAMIAEQDNFPCSQRESKPAAVEKCGVVEPQDLKVVKQEEHSGQVLASSSSPVRRADAPVSRELGDLSCERGQFPLDNSTNDAENLILKEEVASFPAERRAKNGRIPGLTENRANGLILCKRAKESSSASESDGYTQRKTYATSMMDVLMDVVATTLNEDNIATEIKNAAIAAEDRSFVPDAAVLRDGAGLNSSNEIEACDRVEAAPTSRETEVADTAQKSEVLDEAPTFLKREDGGKALTFNDSEPPDVKLAFEEGEGPSLGGGGGGICCKKRSVRRAKSRYQKTAGGSTEVSGATEGSTALNSNEAEQFDRTTSNPSTPACAEESPAQEEAKEEKCAVIRSNRGRAQTLPAYLRDSVLSTVKKGTKPEKKPSDSQDVASTVDIVKAESSREKQPRIPAQKSERVESYASGRSSGQVKSKVPKIEGVGPRTKAELDAEVLEGSSQPYAPVAQNVKEASEVDSPLESEKRGQSILHSSSGGLHPLEEFDLGDIVWAKSGKRNDPVWPAKVIDPKDAPESVRTEQLAGRLCVMFFGPSLAKRERDYAWVKQGMLFPYVEYIAKFTTQTHFNRSRPIDFRRACEEASLADAGFEDCQGLTGKRHFSTWGDLKPDSNEVVDSREVEGDASIQSETTPGLTAKESAVVISKTGKTCRGCGGKLPSKKPKNGGSDDSTLCRACVKLHKVKQYCGVCKVVWLPNEKGNWVMCDKCKIWVHADCDKITTKHLKELEDGDYSCPACRRSEEPVVKKPRSATPSNLKVVPEFLEVICAGMIGQYLPNIHEIKCQCGSCNRESRSMRPSEWEKHTGCRKKKWKESIKVKKTEKPLLHWLQNLKKDGVLGLAYNGPDVPVLTNSRHEELQTCLEVPYEPVVSTWTAERCGICRWVDDWDYNQMIICIRCQIAVHEECYGVRASSISPSSWVCRACETPDKERQCCLCPVKGGALKPTSVEGLWIHVTCAWFMQEVTFPDSAVMEPAEGVTSIPLSRFREVCTICKQVHGACTHCAKCSTPYHTMCGFRAGYYMEIQAASKKTGTSNTRMITYCPRHKDPNPDMMILLRFPDGKLAGPRTQPSAGPKDSVVSLVASNTALAAVADSGVEIIDRGDQSSAARCRGYTKEDKAAKDKKRRGPGIPYRVAGCSWNEVEHINYLREFDELDHGAVLKIEDRVKFFQKTERTRVTFGKSGIHGWGLFARRAIKEGETVLEYRGERVRRIIADQRELRYNSQGKDCYLFKVSDDDDLIIDATEKGNIGRLINHSCDPNCFAKIWEVPLENGKESHHIMLIARRDVGAGEELTYNYRFAPEEKKVLCLCGAPNCTRWLN